MAQLQCSSILREWAPLTELFDKLPTKTGGIFSQDIKLTCIDVLSDFLIIGTNVGVIFWYDRKRKDLQRLRCENCNLPITCVKAVSTVDYMVASGNKAGGITIFQIPKPFPDNLPENLKPKSKQVERYTVAEMHKFPITALEWSKNGMKLFSGDKVGSIVLTELDFYLHVCKSIEILNESYEVVQLSYKQQYLLISTTFRSIVCFHSDRWKVSQVGKKDRKVLGKFGGIMCQQSFKPDDLVLYCMRPGLRIWIGNVEGEVQKTLLFKDLLCKECPQVPLLNPISKTLQQLKPQQGAAFGVVRQFCDNLLVTYSSDVVYFLDPDSMSVLATVNNLRGILDIATYKDELFILEEERSLLRVSYRPECEIAVVDVELNAETEISAAEEAKEGLQGDSKSFDEISKQDFDDSILFSKKVRKKGRNKEQDGKVKEPKLDHGDEEEINFIRPTLMNLSVIGGLPESQTPELPETESKDMLLKDILKLDQMGPVSGTLTQVESQQSVKEELVSHFTLDHESRSDQFKPPTVSNPAVKLVCLPNDWNISNINLAKNDLADNTTKVTSKSIPIPKFERRRSSNNDSSLSDWEII